MTMNKTGIGWIVILLGGVFQIIWAICLDYSEGFSILFWDAIVIIFLFLSIWCLSYPMKVGIAVSTAYTVWIGLGVLGTIIVSAMLGLETIDLTMAFFFAIVVGGVIGLKMTPTETRSTKEQ
jgi:quaternary ammonium compound-resistance protein SugE